MKYQPQLHVVLYQPEIPQNTGNIGRTCVAIGAKLWLVRPAGFRLDDHHLRRAGLDYWQHLEWAVVDDWASLCRHLSGQRLWFFTKTSTRWYTSVAFRRGDTLVFGSETQGLPPSLLRKHGNDTLALPMRNEVRSLNLASAVAVAAYEAVRQLGWNGPSTSETAAD